MADSPGPSNPLRVRFAEFELDEANALLLRDGNDVPLSPTPFELLCALVRRAGSLLTKHALLDEVWGHRFVSDSVLKGTISDIRTALGDDARSPRFIETVARRGYRFIAVPLGVEASGPTVPARRRESVAASDRAAEPFAAPPGEPQTWRSKSFVGRGAMLERLRRNWARTTRGARSLVWIAGEPGIGKSSLVERFSSEVDADACVRGQCVQQYGAGEPYHPVLEAVAELCRRDAGVPALLRSVAPTLLLQLPWVSTAEEREALIREVAGANPERILREIGEFLDRYTQQRPLLLVTEDLHWADQPTLRLIDFLARRRTGARLMWVCTLRLAEVVATDQPLNELRRELLLHGLCEEIVLDPFSEADVGAYLAARWPELADEDAARAVYERTEGVPLFIASLLNDIAARSSSSGVSTAELLTTSPIPETLIAIIDHYSRRLAADQRALLGAAAVCGPEFAVSVLSKVLDRDAGRVADECAELLRGRLWLTAPRPEGRRDANDERYSFRHALFRQLLYDRMGSASRAELHRKVGAVLERERAADPTISAAQLATHFDLGRAPLDALRYYAEAAETALIQLSPAECLSLTEAALKLVAAVPVGTERASLELTLATLRGMAAFHALGAGDEARAAYLHARSLLADVPQHPLRAPLAHGAGQLLNVRGEYAEALATADLAETLVPDGADAWLAIAVAATRGQAYMLQGRPCDARQALERALPSLDSAAAEGRKFVSDPRSSLLSFLAIQLTHLGLVDQARERLEQAYAFADRLGQPVASLVAIWCDALVEVRLGDWERVAALASKMSSLVEQFALAQGRTACRWFQAFAKVRRGATADGFREIRAAYEENTGLGMIAGGSEVIGYAADALVLQGDLDGGEQQLEQAFAIADRHGERIYLPQLLLTKAAIARGRGQSAAADSAIRRSIEESRSQRAPWLELLALTELCERSKAKAADRRALRELMAGLREGRTTPAWARARAAAGRAP